MYPLKTPTNKAFSYHIPGTEHIQHNYICPVVILTEEKDHSTLRQQLSFKNTLPILAQSLQHRRAEKQLCSTQRNRHTGKSSQGARGGTMIIYVLLRRVFSWPQVMPLFQRISLELLLCKCQSLGNLMVYQNYHAEWITGVSFYP